MLALIVSEWGAPRGPLPYAFGLAGLDTREVLSVSQADSLVRSLGSGDCVVVIEAEYLSEEPGCGRWGAFLRRRSEIPVVVTACSQTHASIRNLLAGRDWILLESPFDAAAVVSAARRVCDSGWGETVRRCGSG